MRLFVAAIVDKFGCVSIHTPTRGATWRGQCNGCDLQMFQSTHPHKGCDDDITFSFLFKSKFQSTHPQGVRRGSSMLMMVSPHTFQSTHPQRVRRSLHTFAGSSSGFQSTHPQGVRHERAQSRERLIMFQSTHPHGVRHGMLGLLFRFERVSIHAPTRGAT